MSDILKHFSKSDFFDFEKMNPILLTELAHLREIVNSPMLITSSNDPAQGHAPKSEHYKGNAVDVMFPKWNFKLYGLMQYISQCKFSGIGVYPHWQLNNKMIGGFHLDVRNSDTIAKWIGVKINGKQQYVGWNESNLKKYEIT